MHWMLWSEGGVGSGSLATTSHTLSQAWPCGGLTLASGKQTGEQGGQGQCLLN
jgi:hypothetical protein